MSCSFSRFIQEQAGRHDNYGSALAAQPGKSQGRSVTNSGSQPIVRSTCPPSVLQGPLSRLPPKLRHRLCRCRWDPAHYIPVTNPIESTFATVRHRTIRSKGCLSNKTALAMVFKLVDGAQKSWRRLDGHNQLPRVIEGVKFTDGIAAVRQDVQPAAA